MAKFIVGNRRPLTTSLMVGGVDGRYWWEGRNLNGVSQCTISYGASIDLILVHTVQLKPMIKAHSSGRVVSSVINDVVMASVYSKKTHLKKLMMMIMIKLMMIMIIIIITEKPFTSK